MDGNNGFCMAVAMLMPVGYDHGWPFAVTMVVGPSQCRTGFGTWVRFSAMASGCGLSINTRKRA